MSKYCLENNHWIEAVREKSGFDLEFYKHGYSWCDEGITYYYRVDTLVPYWEEVDNGAVRGIVFDDNGYGRIDEEYENAIIADGY
jgi:hypothetical protein